MKHTKQNFFIILTITCLIFALTACGAKQKEEIPSASVPEVTNQKKQDTTAASAKTETKKKDAATDKKDTAEPGQKDASGTAQKTADSQGSAVQSQETGRTSGSTPAGASQATGGTTAQGSTASTSGSTKPASPATKPSGGSQTGTQTQKPAEPQTQAPAEPQTQVPTEPQTQEPVYEEPGYCKHTNTHHSYAYNIGGWTYPKYTCPHCGQSFYNNGDLHAHWLEETGGEWGEVWLSAPGSSYYIEFTVLEDVSREEAEEVGRQYAAMHPELQCVGICGWYTNHTICDDCGKVLH